MSKRKKWFMSEEEYKEIKNSVSVPAVIRNSMAVKFLRVWSETQTKLEKLIKLASSDNEVKERIESALKLVEGYERPLKLEAVTKKLKKELGL